MDDIKVFLIPGTEITNEDRKEREKILNNNRFRRSGLNPIEIFRQHISNNPLPKTVDYEHIGLLLYEIDIDNIQTSNSMAYEMLNQFTELVNLIFIGKETETKEYIKVDTEEKAKELEITTYSNAMIGLFFMKRYIYHYPAPKGIDHIGTIFSGNISLEYFTTANGIILDIVCQIMREQLSDSEKGRLCRYHLKIYEFTKNILEADRIEESKADFNHLAYGGILYKNEPFIINSYLVWIPADYVLKCEFILHKFMVGMKCILPEEHLDFFTDYLFRYYPFSCISKADNTIMDEIRITFFNQNFNYIEKQKDKDELFNFIHKTVINIRERGGEKGIDTTNTFVYTYMSNSDFKKSFFSYLFSRLYDKDGYELAMLNLLHSILSRMRLIEMEEYETKETIKACCHFIETNDKTVKYPIRKLVEFLGTEIYKYKGVSPDPLFIFNHFSSYRFDSTESLGIIRSVLYYLIESGKIIWQSRYMFHMQKSLMIRARKDSHIINRTSIYPPPSVYNEDGIIFYEELISGKRRRYKFQLNDLYDILKIFNLLYEKTKDIPIKTVPKGIMSFFECVLNVVDIHSIPRLMILMVEIFNSIVLNFDKLDTQFIMNSPSLISKWNKVWSIIGTIQEEKFDERLEPCFKLITELSRLIPHGLENYNLKFAPLYVTSPLGLSIDGYKDSREFWTMTISLVKYAPYFLFKNTTIVLDLLMNAIEMIGDTRVKNLAMEFIEACDLRFRDQLKLASTTILNKIIGKEAKTPSRLLISPYPRLLSLLVNLNKKENLEVLRKIKMEQIVNLVRITRRDKQTDEPIEGFIDLLLESVSQGIWLEDKEEEEKDVVDIDMD